MTSPAVTIVRVRGGDPWWKIHDSAGTIYATKSRWLASLADQYQKNQASVLIEFGTGWYFQELRGLAPIRSLESPA